MTYTPRYATRRPVRARTSQRDLRRFVGVALAGTLLLGVLGMPGGGAVAQEEDPEPTALEHTKQGYWNNKTAKSLPDILTSEFPPGVVCIVFPQSCGDTAKTVTGPISEALPEEDDQPDEPIGPTVPAGTLPVGRAGGVSKYASAVHFELPPTPEGKELTRFTLVLDEVSGYSFDSPATRQAVLAALVGVQTEDPEAAAAEMQKIFDNPDTYPPIDSALLRVEACPVTEDWEAAGSQAWGTLPPTDCIFGAEGQRQEDGTWHFDLTLFAQSVDEETLGNLGILFGPVAAHNFAFGDEDTTDNAQLNFADTESETPPVALIEYQEAATGGEFTLDPGTTTAPPPASSGSSSSGSDTGTFTSTTTSTEAFSSAPAFSSQSAPAPEAAPAVAEPATQPATQPVAQPQVAGAADPGFFWQVWLLLPLGLAGMYVLSRSLQAEPVLATERAGAMSRLIEQRRREGSLRRPLVQV